MYANFTQETCTGAGDTLTLTGNTTGNRPYSRGFVDGEEAAYAVRDSGGVITIAGVGVYNSTGNTITRNDTENDNGTVTDKNPTANIALSAGTHTISCDAVNSDLDRGISRSVQDAGYIRDVFNQSNQNFAMLADTLYLSAIFIPEKRAISNAGSFQIATASGTKLRVGIYSVRNDGSNLPAELLVETANIDSSTTGYNKYLPATVTLQRGLYLVGIISDGTPVVSGSEIGKGIFPYFGANGGTSNIICLKLGVTAGWTTLPADLSPDTFTTESNQFPLGILR